MKPPPDMQCLRVQNLAYAFGPRVVLDGISFDVEPGKVTLLLGPNGAGKTTLFSLIAGLLAPQRGTVTLPTGGKAGLAIVFQQPALDMDLTVEQNLLYHAGLYGMSKTLAQSRLQPLLQQLNLLDRQNDKLRALNGGHRRRVEIIRALMTNPTLLLLDEPTAGLDVPTRKALVAFLHRIAQQRNIAVLWATHLTDEVEHQDDVVVLHNGKLAAMGSVQALLKQSKTTTIEAAYATLAGPVT
jgi:ABC-2 type transport system ATP-binding protein